MPKLIHVSQVTRRDGTDIQKRNLRILELSLAGVNQKSIAARMGITAVAVCMILREMKRK